MRRRRGESPGGWDRLVDAAALLVAAFAWSVAAALSKRLPLPGDQAVSSGAQMLVGGALLVVTAGLLGEFDGFRIAAVSRDAWLALAYLVVPGSIVAYTAYVWLLHHVAPTRVGTYAYVNPVVALGVGAAFGGETLGPRTLLGAALVLVSVVVLTTAPLGRR
jgi:drug/metabolite transporter (DMT)-like permease